MSSIASLASSVVYFDRSYQLTIIPFNQKQGVLYSNTGVGRTGLKVMFEVERTLKADADKAKVSIYNMAPSSRNAITRGSTVFLKAGYQSTPKRILLGFVRKITTERSGPDIVTSLECGDGEPSLVYGAVNRSYKQSVSLAQVLQDLASDLDLEIGGNVVNIGPGVIKGIPAQTFPLGLVCEGAVRQTFTRLLRPHRIDWSIQNGKLIILPRMGTLYTTAQVVGPGTGLINTPGYNESCVTFSSLLNASLVPGAYAQLQSANSKLNGYYRLIAAKFTGDTHGAPWQVDCQGEPLTQPLPTLPLAQAGNMAQAVEEDSSDDDL